MQQAGGFVKWAGADAIGAIGVVIRPEIEAGFGINVPGQHPLPIAYIVRFFCRFAKHDALAGAFFGAFFTDQTKVPNPELYRFVGY